MTKEELLDTLRKCAENHDYEDAHLQADTALLKYINDEEVTAAYDPKSRWWYS